MRFKPKYKQLAIDGFYSSSEELDKTSRWAWLGGHLAWGDFEKQYDAKVMALSMCRGVMRPY